MCSTRGTDVFAGKPPDDILSLTLTSWRAVVSCGYQNALSPAMNVTLPKHKTDVPVKTCKQLRCSPPSMRCLWNARHDAGLLPMSSEPLSFAAAQCRWLTLLPLCSRGPKNACYHFQGSKN